MQSKENTAPLASLPLEPISLRDYFAGQALVYTAQLITVSKMDTARVVAELSYQIADAMLAARTGDA